MRTSIITLPLILSWLSTADLFAGDVVLQTNIPEEKVQGTPMPIQIPNLEPAPTSVPAILVPEGTMLLSAKKPVTASDDFPIVGDLNYLTDGDKNGDEGYYVELTSGKQWIQIDLEEAKTIEAIWLWHYHSQARAYNDVIIQISNTSDFSSDVTTVFNNDSDNSVGLGAGSDKNYIESKFGKVFDIKSIKGRYVRFYTNGNTSDAGNHYIEAEVYGK